MTVSVGEARDKLTQLIKAVEDGEQVTITRHGEPIVDLVRTQAKKLEPRRFGRYAGMGVIVDPNWNEGPKTDEELEAWLEGRL